MFCTWLGAFCDKQCAEFLSLVVCMWFCLFWIKFWLQTFAFVCVCFWKFFQNFEGTIYMVGSCRYFFCASKKVSFAESCQNERLHFPTIGTIETLIETPNPMTKLHCLMLVTWLKSHIHKHVQHFLITLLLRNQSVHNSLQVGSLILCCCSGSMGLV